MNSKALLIIIGILSAIVLAMGGYLIFNLGRQSAQVADTPTMAATAAPPETATVAPPEIPMATPRSEDPAQLAAQWTDAYVGCRGGFGDDPATHAACDLEEQIGQKLEAAGWCYRPGTGKWKPC